MNVLVTGCAGFIGSHATDFFLERGYHVLGVDCFTYAGNVENIEHQSGNPKFRLHRENICDTKKMLELCSIIEIDWIVNFAAETHVDNSIKSSSEFLKTNIGGVRSLLEVCRQTQAKLLHVSTDEVYGSIIEGSSTEESRLDPRNPYSATKAAADHLIKAYHNTYGVDYLIVSPSNNYGPRQHMEKFLPTILQSIAQKQNIPVYGDGSNIREWLFVKDTARAIEHLISSGELNQGYNVSSNTEMKNTEVIEEVCKILSRNPDDLIEFVEDRLGHDFRYSVSNEKLLTTGFSKFTSFENGLRDTVKHYVTEAKR